MVSVIFRQNSLDINFFRGTPFPQTYTHPLKMYRYHGSLSGMPVFSGKGMIKLSQSDCPCCRNIYNIVIYV